MRALVILVAVSYCSAQLVLPPAPWVLPGANLITIPVDGETKAEVKSLPLATSYINPFLTPYLKGFGLTTYSLPLGPHLPYVVAADPTLKATEFPYVYVKVADEGATAPEPSTQDPATEEPAAAVEAARRRRRDVSVPLPYLQAVPTTKNITVETKQFEPVDAATPADTTKIELTTKEHELAIPAVQYVQPYVNLKPVTYTAVSPAVLPYYAGFPAFGYPAFAPGPIIKIDE
ncbi:uncharacterized protein [Macrobrachium rosenbergii]|uniref:uncharacterized protein n=1 Tax=Macrobrachium rosenbergii TaxID=79674 RepID=UPI0034D625ED